MRNLKPTFLKTYIAAILLAAMMCSPVSSKALIDTTLFRIHVIQDSVYAGDTVDVDIFIGGGGLLHVLNILNEFEIQVKSDTSLFEQDNISSQLDTLGWESFFNTTISNILAISTIDIVQGTLNIKGSSLQTGSGNARMARGKYIVQDNVAGRQYMRYDFDKAISKGLLGISNPVKVMTDSVLVLGRPSVPTAIRNKKNENIKIYPNPAIDFIQIEASKVKRYQLLNMNGNIILSAIEPMRDLIQLNLSEFNAGLYILQIQTEENTSQYKIIKH